MTDDPRLQKYGSIDEALEAAMWLKNSRPYMFDNSGSFYDFLDRLKVFFEPRLVIDGKEIDAYGMSEDGFGILRIHEEKWRQRDRLSNVALMVHELAEGYVLVTDLASSPNYSDILSEHFEGDFRAQSGLPVCPTCPLPPYLIPFMGQLELQLQQHMASGEKGVVDGLIKKIPAIRDYMSYGGIARVTLV